MLFRSVWELRLRKTNEPQIVLNARGIKLAGSDFAKWEHIKDERIGRSGSASYSLYFENNEKEISFPLFDVKVDVEELEKMLVFYRKASV